MSSAERRFQEKDLEAAKNGADLYYWPEARDAVVEMEARMPLRELINTYCPDGQLARPQVVGYIEDLPTHEDPILCAFICYQILVHTRNELAGILGIERKLLEEAARGKSAKAVDDDAIRRSAGYSDTIDRNVAESSLTDLAREHRITDDDIGSSAMEGVIYKDETAGQSPLLTFMTETTRLSYGIRHHCTENGQVGFLVKAGVVDEYPEEIIQQIMSLTSKLQPPRDEDK